MVGRKDGSIEFRSSETGDLVKTYYEDNVAKQPGNDSIVGLWSGAE